MRKILVPIDFTASSQKALGIAANLSKKSKAELTLFHVVDQPLSQSFNVEGEGISDGDFEDKLFTLRLIRKAKKQLADAAGRIADTGVEIRQKLRVGNPYHGIQTELKEHPADLVVMGAKGYTRLEGMLIGSNTEKVVRHASCPVLTVGTNSSIAPFKNIIYPTSLSWDQVNIATVLLDLQRLFNATIHVLWVNTPGNFQAEPEVKADLKKLVKKLRLTNCILTVFSDYSEEGGILHYAESVGADLIAMTTHGRTGLAHVLAGSIAEKTLNRAPCPVLTLTTKK